MIEWVQRTRYRWRWRKVAPAAVAVVQQGSGFVARTWPVPLTAASEGWAEVLPDVLAWLTGQRTLPHPWMGVWKRERYHPPVTDPNCRFCASQPGEPPSDTSPPTKRY
ncbi:MAG: hypothetical protein H0X37_25175 [Herpetosiphonaceae bacterium]|nr:hypothetical protein [Herpetosiphonaceae bacterium]